MQPLNEIIRKKPWIGWALFAATIIVVFFLGLLASSIVERRSEALFAYTPRVEHTQFEPRNAVWGQNFPRQYQSYQMTSDTTFHSKHNSSGLVDMLEKYPNLVILWAGYGFSRDYNQGRGHHYAVKDVWNTLRTGAPVGGQKSPAPNTCWTCKSPDVPRLMEQMGVAEFYKGTLDEKGHEIVNSIGCADCHDAKTMNLRISRPALIETYQRLGRDISKASHQEMRSLVCAQCHVEYYFNKDIVPGGDVQYLVFPWDKGILAEEVEQYYDEMGFSDWTHSLSKAPMLKAQHPDYEIYLTGVHASRGVSCADCHMPYISEGGQKFTNHHISSPLRNVANTCQVCHREETERLVKDIYERQDRVAQNRHKLEDLLVRAHVEAKHAWDYGATKQQMDEILTHIRHAQWRWDYVAAGHGSSFHSPVETSRIISSGITIAQEARVKLARLLAKLGHNYEIPMPDISTKAKAQQYIGLDMDKLNNEKQLFLQEVVPEWKRIAAEREENYSVKGI